MEPTRDPAPPPAPSGSSTSSVPAESVIDDLLRANVGYAAEFDGAGRPTAPALRLAVVACMDSRIDVFAALGLEIGDAHVIRNAGGLATDDVVRSLVLSQRLLGTREVVLVAHTRCGLHGIVDRDLLDELETETGARPDFAMGGFDDLDASVRASLARLRDCRWLPHRDSVRGFVFDVDSGALREVT